MNLTKIRNIAGVALLASLAACSGSGSCPPNGSNGDLSLKIEAPAQYPAGIAVTAYLTMTNTSSVDGKNLVYTAPPSTNYTGVTIIPNPTGAGEDCTNIPAGKSCTFTADIPAGSKPGSFTVDATPNGSSVQNTKVAQSGKALQANNSISVTANLGLVNLPSNATTDYRYFILPEVQTITANSSGNTTVMLSVIVNQYGSDFSSFKLVDETGADINYKLVGSQQQTESNSVNTYQVTIPAGKTLQHVRASSNKCDLEGKQYNKALTCSNDAEINLVKLGHGILSVEPSMFNMSESYASQVIKLTNTGSGNVSSINYPAFDVPFSVSNNNCESVSRLAPQQSCTMTINYESTNSTSGQITPVFSYDDDNDVSTDPKNTEIVIPYIGKTTTSFSVLEVSPYSASLTAENSRKVFTITNLAGGNTSGVTISSWTLPTLPAPLELESTNCYAIGANGPAPSPTTKPLNVGDSCVYTIKYSSAESADQASLAFNYNNGIDEQTTNVAIDWVTYTQPVFEQYAYITNYDDSVTKCSIAANGDLTDCAHTGGTFTRPSGIAITPTKTHAYIITNSEDDPAVVTRCTIEPADGSLFDCQDAGATDVAYSSAIAIDSSGTYAYITNYYSGTVTYCVIDPITANFAGCADSGATFSLPRGVALNQSGAIAYVTNSNSSIISGCDVGGGGDDILSNCTSNDFSPLGLTGIAINSTGNRAFITSTNDNYLFSCPVTGKSISLGGCSYTPNDVLDNPYGVALNADETIVYVVNYSNETVSKCAIAGGGTITGCTDSGATNLHGSNSIAIWSPPE